MKNWIKAFIADERGSEGIELGSTVVVVGGGAIAGFASLRDTLQDKQVIIVIELDGADLGAGLVE
jgi:Flp pilus assembly pilin Flp